jgi:predicted O-methyltransferase YrrM
MKIRPSLASLNTLRKIAASVATFHHHAHILLDIAQQVYDMKEPVTYLEIGCYAGATACLMLQRASTSVITVDNGIVVDRATALANMTRFNVNRNHFYYVQGHSRSYEIVAAVMERCKGRVDILFIDGGHTFRDVSADWMVYEGLVAPGGFCVFDDYNDPESPDVHAAVDAIMETAARWEAIGTLKNDLGANGLEGTQKGNCYIARRKS